MRKIFLVPLILIIIGLCIGLAGWALAGGAAGFWIDRHGVHSSGIAKGKLVSIDETFTSYRSIDVRAGYFDRIVLTEGDAYAVRGATYERYGKTDIRIDGDTLKIDSKHNKRWPFVNFGFDDFWNNKDVYLEIIYPKGVTLDSVYVSLAAGKIDAGNIDAAQLNIHNSAGNVEISNVRADVFTATLSAGDMHVRDIKTKNFSASLTAGDIRVDNVDADNVTVKNSFGKIRLDRLVFTSDCDISSSAGDVDIRLDMSEDDISYDLSVSAGNVMVNGRDYSSGVLGSARGGTGEARLSISNSVGDIRVDFR